VAGTAGHLNVSKFLLEYLGDSTEVQREDAVIIIINQIKMPK
jgi:hypothetical protein